MPNAIETFHQKLTDQAKTHQENGDARSASSGSRKKRDLQKCCQSPGGTHLSHCRLYRPVSTYVRAQKAFDRWCKTVGREEAKKRTKRDFGVECWFG